MFVLYLDRYHLGDPLFLSGFARDVLAFDAPLVLVHGAGEAAERALEAQGRFPTVEGGVLAAESPADRALVARAARDLNRQITHTLNDAGVAAVGLEASGRGLVRPTAGGIEIGNIGWFRTIVTQRAIPVVAALVQGEDGQAREVSGGAVAGMLARALAADLGGAGSSATAVFLTKNGQNGLGSSDSILAQAEADAISAALLPEPGAVHSALGVGADVLITGRSGLRHTPPSGTQMSPAAGEQSA